MQLAGADLRLLSVFAAVVKHKGFAAAQVELNISQSTISNHITALEQRLGVRLCQRGRSGFKLSDKGEQVYASVTTLLQSLQDFSAETAALRRELAGKIRFGLVDSIATDPNCRISECISRFNQRPNSVSLEIMQGTPHSLQIMVLADELDFAVGSFPHNAPGLILHRLYGETHSLYCARGHQLFGQDDIEPQEIVRLPAAGRAYWRSSYRHSRTFTNIKATAHSIEAQMLLIQSGAYIGYLPDHFARSLVEAGKLASVRPDAFSYSVDFHLITREGGRSNLIVNTFLEDLHDSFTQSQV